MSELTPEQKAELALVRAIADSLRRRMPDLGDRTLGRVAFHIADLLNGVAVVLTSDADSNLPANWEAPRPQPIDATQPMTRATAQPPGPPPPAAAVTGEFPAQPQVRPGGEYAPRLPARASGEFPAQPPARSSGEFPAQPPARSSGEFPAQPPGRTSGEFPAQPPGRTSGEFPARPRIEVTGEFPAVRPTGEFPAVRPTGELPAVRPTGEFPAVSPTGEFPAVPPTGELPAVRPTGEFPAVRPTGEFPAVRPTGEFPAVRPTGEFPAVRPGGEPAAKPRTEPRIRFPSASSRRPDRPAKSSSRRAELPGDALAGDALAGDRLADVPKGPWIAEFFHLDGTPLEQAQWAERDQALRGVAGRISWLAFDGVEVTVRLRGPGGINMDHEAVLAAIDRMRRG